MPYVTSATSGASPMIEALLVGPEEFERTVVANQKSFDDYRVVQTFEAVAGNIFFEGCTDGGRRSVMGKHHWKFGTSNPQIYGKEAKEFAELVGKMRSAHYALGRAAYKASLRIGINVGKYRLFTYRPYEPTPDPKKLLSGEAWEAIWGHRVYRHMSHDTAIIYDVLKDPEIRGRLLESLGIKTLEMTLLNIQINLEQIWSNPESTVPNRKLALQLWYTYATQTDANWAPSHLIERIQGLLKVALEGPQEVADVAYDILKNLLIDERAMSMALGFLRTLEKKLRGLEEEPVKKAGKLLNLYRAILGTHGKTVLQSHTVEDGALALFDIARVTTLPKADRESAVRNAFDLAHGLLPYGAQMAYAWALWQVEENPDPYMAYSIALAYSYAFTVRNVSLNLATLFPQDTILRAALKRSDHFSLNQRQELWNRYHERHFFWVRWWRSAERRWGTFADREPASVAIQKA